MALTSRINCVTLCTILHTEMHRLAYQSCVLS